MEEEEEIQRLNDKIKQKQAEAERNRKREMESMTRTLANSLTLPSREPQSAKCGMCGATDYDLKELSTEEWEKYHLRVYALPGNRLICNGCLETRKKYYEKELIHMRKEELQKIRYTRKIYETIYRRNLDQAIPRLYKQARLYKLGSKFKAALLNCHKDAGLVLYGPTGVGKTFSAYALMRRLICCKANRDVVFKSIGYELLCLKIRDSFRSGSSDSEYSVIKEFMECGYLLIDDLCSTKAIGTQESEFSLKVIYVLLNHRIENMLPTFITTNKNKENLVRATDDRIASRLSVFTWIGVGGSDKRKLMAKK